MGDFYVSLKGDDDVLSIGLNRAVDLLAQAPRKGGGGRMLGDHPDDGKPVRVRSGRFGPYVEHAGIRANLAASMSAETLTLNDALPLLAAKTAKTGKTGKAAKPAKTAAEAAVKPKAATAASRRPAGAAASAAQPVNPKSTRTGRKKPGAASEAAVDAPVSNAGRRRPRQAGSG